MQLEIIPILTGVPVSSNRGALGWSSVTAVRTQGQAILFDTGSYGDRPLFLHRLEQHGLDPDSFDLVVISHFHFDHMVNCELMSRPTLLIAEPELNYILSDDHRLAGDPYVPLAHIAHLQSRLQPVQEGREIAPGVTTLFLPGHTPGSMGLYLSETGTVLTADAVKNRHDVAHQNPPPSFFSSEKALHSMHRVTSLATTVVPGHDRAFSLTPGLSLAPDLHDPVSLSLSSDPWQPPQKISLLE